MNAEFLRAIQANAVSAPLGGAWGRTPEPADPLDVVITFDQGVPVALDRETLSVLEALQELNRRAGGLGSLALTTAHQALESITLESDLLGFKAGVDRRWAELVHDLVQNGQWDSPLKDALDTFIATSQARVSGEVRLALRDGRAVVTGRRGEESLYDFHQTLVRDVRGRTRDLQKGYV
ncbi:argininosuccinate synthase [Allokutzneria sp. A3M-2-11 16]|uniref:argininosuccinate synthase domain-containing protein n=1 Tax=Allokutzneria sp. A3M-2-11 16 TaxID=2962043 RepID=UPI0020B6E29C|nr:argininosuccinate synthase domain-containing protein [Allokutzneria sp. A3M-2-11 16]MCP3804582.1 argininosuccinate synthase [Allokutzneria sp. A3M-2-11 16]